MPLAPEAARPGRGGFVLPVVMGLILIAGLIAVHAAADMGAQSTLSTNRLLHQRAFEAGESGIAAVLEQLRAGQEPPATQRLASAVMPSDRAQVAYTLVARHELPEGHSAGRIIESHHEIRSEGHSARNARVVIVQGVRRHSVGASP